MALLVVLVAGTGYWGYQEHQDKNSILIKSENNYQRAFHSLNNNMSNLENELGKSIAMNSRNLLAPCLANVWRLSYAAQSNIGQLPLTLTPFHQTERFLAKIAEYTHDIGMRDLENEPINDEEWQQLKSLHQEAKEVQGQLRNLQSKVLNNNLRWMDVEMAIASENMEMGKTILNGFEGIDQQVQGYTETEWGATDNQFGNHFSDKKEQIEGPKIDGAKAKKIAKEFLALDSEEQLELEENGEAHEFSSYSIHAKPNGQESLVSIDVSSKGGHVLWFLDSRDIEETELGLNEAENEALQFLEERDITSMVSVQADQYDNVGVFDFVYEEDDIRFYTDLVRIKVALDTGDIIGYEGLDYVVAHDQEKDVPEERISLEEAQEQINPNFDVQEYHLSMVEIQAGESLLCYELLGTIGEETYRIFINAVTGDEEKVEKMKESEPIV